MARFSLYFKFQNYVSDFNESESAMNLNSSVFSFSSDEFVSFSEMSAETVVSIDDAESAGVP